MPTFNSSQALLNRLKLRHLRVVLALHEMGTAVAVASRFHVSPAAISKTLAEIEGIVGMPLFERGARGLLPTEAGRDLIEHASVLLAQLSRLADSLQAVREGNKGKLRIASRTASVQWLLAQVTSDFYRDHPLVQISMLDGAINEMLENLRSGLLDLLFAYDDPRLSGPEFERASVLAAQRVVIVASVGHPIHTAHSFSAQQLALLQWCIPPAGSRMLYLLHAAFHALGSAPPLSGICIADMAYLSNLMQAGQFLTVCPEQVAKQLERAKIAKTLDFELNSYVEPVVMVWNSVLTPPPQVRRFRALLLQRVEELGMGNPF
ncbi:LysR family transcriptional regulator [Allopusillimonas ginsengisoli]|uniref:LysR family transcriptional regulator n=1 Tax=Allopusillimonas ginsengisoli TaxID=453575 RepID=UPI00101FE7B9|nr:LysR family transcriptional regulator [Allopusillimonas ginsengisoli]TEA77220.1 LysR family transcriptional regulator [Allopusillimonas ginsengisoli]